MSTYGFEDDYDLMELEDQLPPGVRSLLDDPEDDKDDVFGLFDDPEEVAEDWV
jgi:hypothetical protein